MTRTEFFDRLAQSENPLLFSAEEHKKVHRLKDRLGDLRGAKVMEPGCGAGPLTAYLSQWVGENGEVFAFDASPAMVDACRRRAADWPNVRVEHAVLGEMSLEKAAWDWIILFRVFPHLEQRERILASLREALKPGGRLVIANLEGCEELNRWHAQCEDPIRRDHMPSARELKDLLQRVGYSVADIKDDSDGFLVIARPNPL